MSSTTDVVLTCQAGWDGGLNQTFTLEVRDDELKHKLKFVKYSPTPEFTLKGLATGKSRVEVIILSCIGAQISVFVS